MASQPKRLQRSANRTMTAEEFPGYVRTYLEEKAIADQYTARINTKKAVIATFVDQYGDLDDKGSKYVDVEGIEGVSAVKRERRSSTSLDEDKAIAWLKKNKLWEKYSTLVPEHREFDAEAFAAAGYTEDIPDRVMASFITVHETWATKTVK